MLRDAGIKVDSGVLENEARRLNEAFITYKTEHRPFGILKIAMTLDGKIATRDGESQWITSEESREAVHLLRHRCDAVVTGSGTDPEGQSTAHRPQRPSPPAPASPRGPRPDAGASRNSRMACCSAHSLDALVAELYKREIQSFLMECGPDLAFNALRAGIVDKIVVFVAPKILGGRDIPAIGGERHPKPGGRDSR